MRTIVAISLLILLAAVACDSSASEQEIARCQDAPVELVQQLSNGLTIEGSNVHVDNVQIVESNDEGLPWKFIGGTLQAPGIEGQKAVWATVSLDLDRDPNIVAADYVAEEFSIAEFPRGDRLYFSNQEQYKDELRIVKACIDQVVSS